MVVSILFGAPPVVPKPEKPSPVLADSKREGWSYVSSSQWPESPAGPEKEGGCQNGKNHCHGKELLGRAPTDIPRAARKTRCPDLEGPMTEYKSNVVSLVGICLGALGFVAAVVFLALAEWHPAQMPNARSVAVAGAALCLAGTVTFTRFKVDP